MVIKQNKGYKLPLSKLEIINKYNAGLSCYSIAKICNCTPQAIYYIIKKANVSLRTLSEAATKYTHDTTFFNVIDTEEKAYYLGLLYADGNVSNNVLSISLQIKDQDILEKFKKIIKYTGPLLNINKPGNRQNQIKLSITSPILIKNLLKHGLYPNKGTTLSFPTTLSENLYPHFIRGYFDGDGCIYTNNKSKDYLFSMLGPHDFLIKIQNILISNLAINKTKLYNPKNCKITKLHVLTYQGRLNLIKICNYLYANSTCYLERKYNKYINL
jgi:intein-encoded DNA endonuclease-like protein